MPLVEFEGRKYQFPEDSSPEEVYSFLELQAVPSWGQTLKAIPPVAVGETQKALGGLIRAGGEAVGARGITEAGAGIAESGQLNVEAASPRNLTYWKRAVLSGGASALQQAPFLALSVATGGIAPAVAAAGAIAGGTTYGEARG